MRFASPRTEASIDVAPDLFQETRYSTETSQVGQVTQSHETLLEEGAEGGVCRADGASDEVDPDETSIVSSGSGGDELENLRESRNEANTARLAGSETWHETAQVDSSGQTEGGRHVPAQLLWAQDAIRVEGDLRSRSTDLRQANLITEGVNMLAELDVIHAFSLERFQAGNLGNQVHDTVFTAHQFAQTKR